jgi:hypothetical protein
VIVERPAIGVNFSALARPRPREPSAIRTSRFAKRFDKLPIAVAAARAAVRRTTHRVDDRAGKPFSGNFSRGPASEGRCRRRSRPRRAHATL